jgi:hypothetical protein
MSAENILLKKGGSIQGKIVEQNQKQIKIKKEDGSIATISKNQILKVIYRDFVLFGESENMLYIEGNNQFIDMCMMSMCSHNIIANSSFSWWAAWLNNNRDKKIIAPKKWFGPSYYYHDTKDLYCQDWIII